MSEEHKTIIKEALETELNEHQIWWSRNHSYKMNARQNHTTAEASSKPWFEGRRIVDLKELARQMNCKRCSRLLGLNQIIEETKFGLASVMCVVCECGARNAVFTDKLMEMNGEKYSFAINMLFPSNMGQYRLVVNRLASFLALLNIPVTLDNTVEDLCLNLPSFTRISPKSVSYSDSVMDKTHKIEKITKSVKLRKQLSKRIKAKLQFSKAGSKQIENESSSPALKYSQMKIKTGTGGEFNLVPDADAPMSEMILMGDVKQVRDQDEVNDKAEENSSLKECVSFLEDAEMFPPSSYKCPLCAKLLPSSRGFLIHLSRLHHRSNFIAEEHKVSLQSSGASFISATETWSNEEATDDTCLSMNAAGDHLRNAEKNMCEDAAYQIHNTESASLSSTAVCITSDPGCTDKEIRSNRTFRRWQCSKCHKDFKLFDSYSIHVKKCIFVDGMYRCSVCSEAFITQRELKKHLKSHPQNKKQKFTCNICEEVLPNAFRLKKHKRAFHPKGSKQVFTCQECLAEFSHRCFLKTHMRKHTGERPYKCHFCSATFISTSNRNSHIRRHHSKMRTYLCETCGSGFYENRELQDHERIHTGEKPFSCSHCSRVFARKSTLRIHKRQHTGEKPYQCEKCGAAFVQIVSLRTHRSRKHPEINPCDNPSEGIGDAD